MHIYSGGLLCGSMDGYVFTTGGVRNENGGKKM